MKERNLLLGRIVLLLLLAFVSFLTTLFLYLIGVIIVSFIIGLGIKKMSNEYLFRDRGPKINGIEIFLAMELGFIPAALVTACFFPTIPMAISVLCFLSFGVIFFLLGRLITHILERKKQKTEK